MKKFILSAALIAGLTFAACSSDDDAGSNNNNNNNSGCVTCTMTMGEQTEQLELCREDYETQEEYDQAVEMAEMVGDCAASS